ENILNTETGVITVAGAQSVGMDAINVDGRRVENLGEISVTGKQSVGLQVSSAHLPSGVENRGEIHVEGDSVVGIHIEHSNVGRLLNDGQITVKGNNAFGIDLDHGTTLSELDMDGTTTATGEGAVAVLIDGADFFDGSNEGRQVRNGGTVQGEKTALEIEYFKIAGDSAGTLTIDNRGSILGGNEAIDAEDASGLVNLLWHGAEDKSSTIRGDLINLSD